MNLDKLMRIVESERLSNKVHKTTLCAKCDISTTYYNELLKGIKNPSINIVTALLSYFDIELLAVKVY